MVETAPAGSKRLATQAEYAKHRDVSRAMISKYFRGKRLVTVDGLIDVEASDEKLAGSICALHGGKRTATGVRGPAARSARPEGSSGTFMEERTQRERFAAKLLQVEYDQAVGSLVDRDAYNRGLAQNIGPAIQRLRTISARLGARVAAESDVRKCTDLIDAEVESICQEIADGATAMADGAGKTRQ